MHQTILRRTVLFASAILLGASCVHAALQIRAALGPHATREVIQTSGSVLGADPLQSHLFGVGTDSAPAAAAAPPPNLKLTGVIAGGSDAAAVAVISVDGKAGTFRRGESLAPALTLDEIQADRVVLLQGGQKIELPLLGAAPNAAPATPVPAASQFLAPRPVSAPPGPPMTTGSNAIKLEVNSLGPNHLGFSRAELSRALQDPRQMNVIGKASVSPGSGVVLDEVPPGSLPDKLGLRQGDILRQTNGQTVTSLSDLPRMYQEFGTASAVRLDILRGGQPMLLQYTVRP